MKNKRGLKKYLAGILSTALILSLVLQAGMVYAEEDPTKLNLEIRDGDLTISVPPTVVLKDGGGEDPPASGEPVDVMGTISEIEITDLRGDASGWYVSVDLTHLGLINPSSIFVVTGEDFAAEDISVTGIYNGRDPVAAYGDGDGEVHAGNISVKITDINGDQPTLVEITSPGDNVTKSNLPVVESEVSAFGLTFEFEGGEYAENDEFKVAVDHQSYIQAKLDYVEESLETSGSTDGLNTEDVIFTHEDEYEIRGQGDENVVRANAGYGAGVTTLDNELTWTIHANPLMGNYQAILTYTVTG